MLLRWLILAVSLILASILTKALGLGFEADASSVAAFLKLMVGVAILSLLNATLGNVLKLLTVPLNCLTLGLVSLVINAAMLQIAGSLEFGFRVRDFWAAFVGSLILSAVNGILTSVLGAKDKEDKSD